MAETVIGIDPSYTATGIVVLNSGGQVLATKTIKTSAEKSCIKRAADIAEDISHFFLTHKPILAVIEGFAYARTKQAHQLGYLGYRLREYITCSQWGHSELLVVAPTQVKKFATGKGQAPKDIILQQVYKRWHYEAKNNNIADAYILARIGLAYLKKETDLPAFQLEVLKAIQKNADVGV